ncbi:MAG: BON domain-containing protein [Deltaproteobacteria bacterium]|nr:BON domain-containing protein [Deltaproteobacteria bacterium]
MNKRFFSLFLMIFALPALIHCSATATRRSMGETLDDAVITNKLKTRFMKDKTIKAFQIDIDTWKGVVSLRGRVESQDQIYRAIEMAEQQAGVKEVKSYLVLRNEEAPVKSSSPKRKTIVEEEDVVEKDSAKTIDDNEAEPEANEPDQLAEEKAPQVTPD